MFQTDPRAAADTHVGEADIRCRARDACDDEGVTEAVRVLVVSHACVRAANQAVYAHLATTRDVAIVCPARWRDPYAPRGYAAEVAPALAGRIHPVRVVGIGRPQRHVYVARCRELLDRHRPQVLLIEEEPFSVAARQWAAAARARRVPFGVQMAETKERSLPGPVARWRDRVLRDAAFVVARSPTAADLARAQGARGEVAVVPHGLELPPSRPEPAGTFTVAYVGRLVEDKGVADLLAAATRLTGDVAVIVAGGGPLEDAVRSAGGPVTWLGALAPEDVDGVYARAHVTCVPSRATPTWEEQFGRVVVESLARGVPVVATSTGELAWVLSVAPGGVLVGERDPDALAAALSGLAADRARARALGEAGRAGVARAFTNEAVAAQLDAVVDHVTAR